MKNTVVLGGGISGITAAYFLGKHNATIYEKNSYYGGLCNSFLIDDFVFDTAVHFSFTKNKYVKNIFDEVPYYSHNPRSYNYYAGHWLKHPVQNNLYNLPVDEKVKCISDFINRPIQRKNIDNYEEWLKEQYGNYISEVFPMKYTKKYWGTDARKLGIDWINNRMCRPSLEEVLKGAMTDDTTNAYYVKEMRYPKHGGYKSFLKPMLPYVDIKLNKEAILINAKSKYVEFKSGEKIYYDNLISSIPITEIIKLMIDVPEDVIDASKNLFATSMRLISVGFNRKDVAKYLWFYIYDDNIYPSRVYSPNLKSPNNVPRGYSALQFEVYESEEKKINLSDGLLCEHLEKSIKKMNLADSNDILFMHVNHEKYANVIFYKDIYKNRKIVHDYLKSKNIKYIGRFGEWDYLWSDQSFLSGMNVK
ncbi:protoporphyrinogen/coproporphyrinogen oxidase [Clostridium tyrobutyricum]|uniref:protoporphyrinogen/coproporphyrinogen oxidase n=1 Tax=Clostridium tyrobutyricum TaxID=1519 RepID=UPI000363FF67|nr:NAD(P)-binding protein [Clostridium tyrobutyricum]